MARILVVDDEYDTVEMVALLLGLDGHSVDKAYSGTGGLSAAAALKPDLILTDWMMPDMDGIELCRRLKQDTRTREIPVVLNSAGIPPDGEAALYDDFLRKPWDIGQLRAIIRKHVPSRAGGQGPEPP